MCGAKDLLKSDEFVHLNFPNYYCVNEFQKKNLLSYIQSKQELCRYLPDTNNLINIPRNYLLCVSFDILI